MDGWVAGRGQVGGRVWVVVQGKRLPRFFRRGAEGGQVLASRQPWPGPWCRVGTTDSASLPSPAPFSLGLARSPHPPFRPRSRARARAGALTGHMAEEGWLAFAAYKLQLVGVELFFPEGPTQPWNKE